MIDALKEAQQHIHESEVLIAEYKWVEEALRKRTREMAERAKELDCIYAISRLLTTLGQTLDHILDGIANLMPSGWQYPEATCARIVLKNKEYRTPYFRTTKWKQSTDINVNGKRVGFLQIYCFAKQIDAKNGPFLAQEQDLLNAIAIWIGEIIEHRSDNGDRG